jgi:hypothetical protein
MRKAFSGLAGLLMLAVVAQFFLAASGAFDTAPNDQSFRPHRALGYGIVLFALLLTIVAAVARMPGRLIGLTGLVAGLAAVQGVIGAIAKAVGDTGGQLVFGLHAINALVIVVVIRTIFREARELSAAAVPAQPVS